MGEGTVADSDATRQPIEVVLRDEPPRLTPGAARALLRILVKAAEKQALDGEQPGALTREDHADEHHRGEDQRG
jgi:hypothetical protein